MCTEKEFPMNFVPVKSIHLSLVEEKDKFFIIDEVSSKVLITFNNEINAQNAMKQITDNLSTTINHILTISQQNIQILE